MKAPSPDRVRVFATAADFRAWLLANHADAREADDPLQWPLPAADEEQIRADPAAWAYWRERPAGYRRQAGFWVQSAKRPETRQRRLATLIADSADGRPIKPLRYGRGERC